MEMENSSQADIESASDCHGINLRDDTETIEQNSRKCEKRPKRILQFSDGEMVEYSSEDEADAPKAEARLSTIDTKNLDWIPWAWHGTVWVGSKLLNGCDYMGEALADFLGITSPKYQFEIDEYKRMHAAQAEESHRQNLEMGGWNENHRDNIISTENVTNSD